MLRSFQSGKSWDWFTASLTELFICFTPTAFTNSSEQFVFSCVLGCKAPDVIYFRSASFLLRSGWQTSRVNREACRITTVSIPVSTSSPRLQYLDAAVSPLPRGSRSTESVQNRQLIYGLKSFASFPLRHLEVLRGAHVPMRAENQELSQAASTAFNPQSRLIKGTDWCWWND